MSTSPAVDNVRALHVQPPPLLERIFIGRSPSQAYEYATVLLEERAGLLALCRDRGETFELRLLELREAVEAKARARERLLAGLL